MLRWKGSVLRAAETQLDFHGKQKYEGSADIYDCGKYRYKLTRGWHGGDGRTVCFIMLNPSTADSVQDDPTIRRCVAFAKRWGFSTLEVRNLYALRATDPRELKKVTDPIGMRGNESIADAASADLIVAAWGAHAPPEREREVRHILRSSKIMCLGLTKKGLPRHPLFLKHDTELMRYKGAWEGE